ncbi:HNH endonuclease signature motif containing protein [Serratia fonticola]|uniref:HNH endonuclease signature motif containing protein n=1 Tax=Serratia fonticola TaxID=47917 RepID=UPI003AF34308
MAENRPAIPEAVKREVRQQCFFGCAICGMPFFQYDHIEEYADVREHVADNLVLLCPNHHSAKTTNKISKDRIIYAKREPFNASKEYTSGFRVEPSKEIDIFLGSNKITGWYPNGNGVHHALWANGKSFFTIHSENGWLSISMILTDSAGKVLLVVEKGELVIATSSWDYVYEGSNIKIRSGMGYIQLDMNLSDNFVEIINGYFIDDYNDGFFVSKGTLNLVNGKINKLSVAGSTFNGNGFGGVGILNRSKFPSLSPPSGFGLFCPY